MTTRRRPHRKPRQSVEDQCLAARERRAFAPAPRPDTPAERMAHQRAREVVRDLIRRVEALESDRPSGADPFS